MPEGHVGFDLLPISRTNQKNKSSANSVSRASLDERAVNISMSKY